MGRIYKAILVETQLDIAFVFDVLDGQYFIDIFLQSHLFAQKLLQRNKHAGEKPIVSIPN